MTLDDDHMATVLATVRSIPEGDRDHAWAYIAQRLRVHPHVIDDDVADACAGALRLFGRGAKRNARMAA